MCNDLEVRGQAQGLGELKLVQFSWGGECEAVMRVRIWRQAASQKAFEAMIQILDFILRITGTSEGL